MTTIEQKKEACESIAKLVARVVAETPLEFVLFLHERGDGGNSEPISCLMSSSSDASATEELFATLVGAIAEHRTQIAAFYDKEEEPCPSTSAD